MVENLQSTSGSWLVPIKRCDNPKLRLICFPYGGGGAASFWGWQSELPYDIELWAVHLPGRENRIAEHFITDANSVVEFIFEELKYLHDIKFAFYGHSLGAGIAYETAKLLRLKNETLPSLFIASGRLPPHQPCRNWANQPEEELIGQLLKLGGVPLDFLNSTKFLLRYLPKIRADFKVNETLSYEYSPAFNFPITIINGTDDPLVNEDQLREWRDYTNCGFKSFRVKGGHFFIQSNFSEFICILSEQLSELSL